VRVRTVSLPDPFAAAVTSTLRNPETDAAGGVVANGVLAANVARHLGGNLIGLPRWTWGSTRRPRFPGTAFERAARMAYLGAGHSRESNPMSKSPAGELLHARDGLLQSSADALSSAVGDDHQHLLGPLGVGGQLVGRSRHGIVERGAALGVHLRQAFAELLTSEVNSQSMKASSEKLTTKASSWVEARIISRAALLTEGRLLYMEPELSITRPMDTGRSVCWS